MNSNNIKSIFNKFEHNFDYVSHSELNSGHINDTYLVKTDGETNYVLQKINHLIFKDVPGLVSNKVQISNHIKVVLSQKGDNNSTVLSFVKVKGTDIFYYKEDKNYWNLMIFIDNGITYDIVSKDEIAFEGGKLLGQFLNLTSTFNSKNLIETIPNFHDMSFRYKQYVSAIHHASLKRLKTVEKYAKLIASLKEEMHILQKLKELKKIPLRVTHNDTKISNSLFDANNKGICMIDTDTVMPGIIHYDFGDAIRTICNSAAEDEKNLSKIEFNFKFYKAYKKGFLKEVGTSLTHEELKHLPLAVKTMIFIMGLRFLTDYLNNDVYYKIKYPEHNLDRAKNQFKLLESFLLKLNEV